MGGLVAAMVVGMVAALAAEPEAVREVAAKAEEAMGGGGRRGKAEDVWEGLQSHNRDVLLINPGSQIC